MLADLCGQPGNGQGTQALSYAMCESPHAVHAYMYICDFPLHFLALPRLWGCDLQPASGWVQDRLRNSPARPL